MVNVFFKPGKNLCTRIFRSVVMTAGVSCICATGVLAEDPLAEKPSSLVGLRRASLGVTLPPPSGTELYNPDTTLKGIRKMDLSISGTVRFLTIYRNMSEYYPDLATASKNFSFTEYQAVGGGTANTGGVPNLELLLSSKLRDFNFNVGYSFLHTFTGQTAPAATSAKLTVVNNLWFSGLSRSGHVNFYFNAGTILWTSLSRFTMGQPNYRDNYFQRVPWDWYRQSFTRWDEYYSMTTNIGAQGNGRSALAGFVAVADFYRLGLTLTGIYGRTNTTLAVAQGTTNFPAYVSGFRVEKTIFTRAINGRLGVNLYTKDAYTERNTTKKDVQQIISVDAAFRWKKILLSGEVGMGRVDNPQSDNQKGIGFYVRADFDKKISSIPFGVEFYQIDYDMASVDGGIINSNSTVHGGGYATEFIYDNFLMINTAQEVGQVANNRRGLFLTGEAQVQKLKINLGLGISQEIENRSDTITMQHKVNAMARSRFHPWFHAGGPYSRLKSGWMRTWETFTITDANRDYKKGFNTAELLLKYKLFFLGKDLVILNFHNFCSIQDKLSPVPVFTANNSVFVRQYFTDITLAYRLSKKISLSTYAGIEKLWGSKRINLAEPADVYDPNPLNKDVILVHKGSEVRGLPSGPTDQTYTGKPVFKETGLPVDQTGYGFGVGIDYDFSPTAGIHLRHTWFSQKDKNFILDKFKGQETNLELKLFF